MWEALKGAAWVFGMTLFCVLISFPILYIVVSLLMWLGL